MLQKRASFEMPEPTPKNRNEASRHLMLKRQSSINQNKKKTSGMLTDFKNMVREDHSGDFANYYCSEGHFTLYQAEEAVRLVNQSLENPNSWGRIGVPPHTSMNTMLIMMGLALVNELEALFEAVVGQLGDDIGPFSNDFK